MEERLKGWAVRRKFDGGIVGYIHATRKSAEKEVKRIRDATVHTLDASDLGTDWREKDRLHKKLEDSLVEIVELEAKA